MGRLTARRNAGERNPHRRRLTKDATATPASRRDPGNRETAAPSASRWASARRLTSSPSLRPASMSVVSDARSPAPACRRKRPRREDSRAGMRARSCNATAASAVPHDSLCWSSCTASSRSPSAPMMAARRNVCAPKSHGRCEAPNESEAVCARARSPRASWASARYPANRGAQYRTPPARTSRWRYRASCSRTAGHNPGIGDRVKPRPPGAPPATEADVARQENSQFEARNAAP